MKINTPLGYSVLTVLIFLGSLSPFVTTNAPEQIGFVPTLLCSLAAFLMTMAAISYAVFIKARRKPDQASAAVDSADSRDEK